MVENLSHLPPARTGSENMEDGNDPDCELLTLISLPLWSLDRSEGRFL